jgi:hypothetical protein
MLKRFYAFALLLATSSALLAQTPDPNVVLPIPDNTVKLIISILGSAFTVYNLINGLKDYVPAIANNKTVLRILTFVGNLLVMLPACFILGHVNDAFDVVKCVVASVIASLGSAGFYHAKQNSDIARAGGAAQLENAKAIADVAAKKEPDKLKNGGASPRPPAVG